MQVKPFVPGRRIFKFPWGSTSAIVAALAISGGPADNARAILVSVDSFAVAPEDSIECIWPRASKYPPANASATMPAVSMGNFDLLKNTVTPPLFNREALRGNFAAVDRDGLARYV
jgi:hypothetical protein